MSTLTHIRFTIFFIFFYHSSVTGDLLDGYANGGGIVGHRNSYSGCDYTCPVGKGADQPCEGECDQCLDCVDGKYSPENDKVCLMCPAGMKFVKSGVNLEDSCAQCEEGKWSYEDKRKNPLISQTYTECTSCPSGERNILQNPVYVRNQDYAQEICKTCEDGKYSTKGAASCTSCEAGKKWISVLTCRGCEVGKYSAGEGSLSCTDCAEEQYAPEESSSCSTCPEGKTFKNNKYASTEEEACQEPQIDDESSDSSATSAAPIRATLTMSAILAFLWCM